MQSPVAEFFSLVPEILVDQAFFHDFAEFPTPFGAVRLAYFTRIAHVSPCDGALIRNDGKCNGVQLVAYYCDADGTIYDWEKRYEIETISDGCAVLRKLRLMLANDLAQLFYYEGITDTIEEIRAEMYRIDWEQMPAWLQ